jgi:hypothetical protein
VKETVIDWLGTFWKVLIRPTPKTFLEEAKKAEGKPASAIGLLIFYGLYVYILASIGLTRAPLSFGALIAATLVIPLGVLIFTSSAYYLCQRLPRRKKYNYDKMLYLNVAILLPILLVTAPLFVWDVFPLSTAVLFFYQIALLTISIKSLADIEYWQALVIIFLSTVATILVCVAAIRIIYATVTPITPNNTIRITSTPSK